ncbi:hypothetical protein Tco_1287111, partial [Tanacetum coccineum]
RIGMMVLEQSCLMVCLIESEICATVSSFSKSCPSELFNVNLVPNDVKPEAESYHMLSTFFGVSGLAKSLIPHLLPH